MKKAKHVKVLKPTVTQRLGALEKAINKQNRLLTRMLTLLEPPVSDQIGVAATAMRDDLLA